MVKVSYLYYHQSLNQKDIADIFGVSSNTISRILDEAKKQNIVRIEINYNFPRNSYLEKIAEKMFSSTKFVVVRDTFLPTDRESTKVKPHKYLGEAGAYYLPTLLTQNDRSLGVSGGRTLSELAKNIKPDEINQLDEIVQITGGEFESVYERNSTTVLQQLCERLGKNGYYFHTPAYIRPENGRAQALSKHNKTIREKWDALDVVLVGVGSFNRDSTVHTSGLFTEAEIEKLSANNAVGEVGLHFFDEGGKIVDKELDAGVQGINWDKLKKLPKVIAIGGGLKKLESIKGILNAGLVDVLVTFEKNINQVLGLNEGEVEKLSSI